MESERKLAEEELWGAKVKGLGWWTRNKGVDVSSRDTEVRARAMRVCDNPHLFVDEEFTVKPSTCSFPKTYPFFVSSAVLSRHTL